MDINVLKQMTYDEIRAQFLLYLQQQDLALNTIKTAYTDTFYLWRQGDSELFWTAVDSDDSEARRLLLTVLQANTRGNADKLVNGYLSHLRRFRSFLRPDKIVEKGTRNRTSQQATRAKVRKMPKIDIPDPSPREVEAYLKKWEKLGNYQLQEIALDKLFFELCPKNTDISDILIKVSTLNDFYSTNIFSVYAVAEHILSLNIDNRLKAGDVTLVNSIKRVTINGKEHNFYSFASKYCSHHKPSVYPIYDSYVDRVLRHFRNQDNFSAFMNEDLKDYVKYIEVLLDFQKVYGLEKYNFKDIDKYLWQVGKDYFPKNTIK